MRRFALLLAFALPLFGYEIRSPRYALTVDVNVGSYAVAVTDLVAQTPVFAEQVTKANEQMTKTFTAGDLALHMRIRERDRRLDAELRIERGPAVLDVLHATWLTAPYAMPTGTAPLRVGGDVRAPVVIKRVEPLYTEEAKQAGVWGIVILEVVIDRTGKVTEARALKPLPFGLDQAAIDAVRQWEFQPGTLNGDPVDVIFNLTVNFKLESSD